MPVRATLLSLILIGCKAPDNTLNAMTGSQSASECSFNTAITKRSAGDFEAGGLGRWEIQVDWQGGEYCAQDLCIIDMLPASQSLSTSSTADPEVLWDCEDSDGEVTCCVLDFTPATSLSTYTLDIAVDISADAALGAVENCAMIDIVDTIDSDNTSCATATIQEPSETVDLSITKSIQGTLTSNEAGAFTFTVTNNGTSLASEVIITDLLPNGMVFEEEATGKWDCTGDDLTPETVTCLYPTSLAANASETMVLPVFIDLPEEPTGTNCASVSSAEEDANPDDNISCVDYEIAVPDEECGNCLDDDGDGLIDEDCEYELEVLFTADDELELFIDSTSQGTYLGWSTSDTVTTTITGGTHYVAAHAYDVGGAISGFRAQISLDGDVLARTGDGSFMGSNSHPGVGWQSSTAGLWSGPNLCYYDVNWETSPSDLEVAGTDWIWFSTSPGCSPYSAGDENFIVYAFETCPETNE